MKYNDGNGKSQGEDTDQGTHSTDDFSLRREWDEISVAEIGGIMDGGQLETEIITTLFWTIHSTSLKTHPTVVMVT